MIPQTDLYYDEEDEEYGDEYGAYGDEDEYYDEEEGSWDDSDDLFDLDAKSENDDWKLFGKQPPKKAGQDKRQLFRN